MISVDTVYKTVLYILNKEQRGYLTPEEFNSLAEQVQLEIFEKYFEDLTMNERQIEMNDSEYANRSKTIQEKISFFETNELLTGGSPFDLTGLTTELHRLGTIEYTKPMSVGFVANPTVLPVMLEEVTQQDYNLIRRSKLTSPSETWPIFTLKGDLVYTLPNLDEIEVYYVRKPASPIWAYTVGTLGQYINDPPPNSVDFEISSIDQTEVILRILAYAGVIIRDEKMIATATRMAQSEDIIEQS